MKPLSDPGPMPQLLWIDKALFIVDHSYQREIETKRSQENIVKIAQNFCWAMFQAPTVTPGLDGKYYVIDGQHRVAAVRRRPDITEIPCYVIPSMSQADQARAFVAINRDRTSLTPYVIHHAQVKTGEPEAVRIHQVCEEAGVVIAKYPTVTKPEQTIALGTIKLGLRKYGEPVVIYALMIIPECYPDKVGMIRGPALQAIMRLVADIGIRDVNRDALLNIFRRVSPVDLELRGAMYVHEHGDCSRQEAIYQILKELYDRKINPKGNELWNNRVKV